MTPLFDVISDGGLDPVPGLRCGVPAAPFSLHFGDEVHAAPQMDRAEFYRRLRAGNPHPSTSQPPPAAFAALYAGAQHPVLCVTISSGLSGSFNSAEQARAGAPQPVTVHDSGTLSGAQAFQVHAAMTARERGEGVQTALDWMRQVHEQTELYFAIDTLEYLRRGGRIGRVQATLGGLLKLRPVVTVEKPGGIYTTAGRARSWNAALDSIVSLVTARYGAGTPLHAAVLLSEDAADGEALAGRLRAAHPLALDEAIPASVGLTLHTGPKAVGVAVMPARWPWET